MSTSDSAAAGTPMSRLDHLLIRSMEECAEVAQRISKALVFGLQEVQPGQALTNRERIEYELNDLLTLLHMADIIQIDHEGYVQVDAAMQGEKERKVEEVSMPEMAIFKGLSGMPVVLFVFSVAGDTLYVTDKQGLADLDAHGTTRRKLGMARALAFRYDEAALTPEAFDWEAASQY